MAVNSRLKVTKIIGQRKAFPRSIPARKGTADIDILVTLRNGDRKIMIYRDRATSGERNFIERIKAPIFFDAILAIKVM